MVRVPQLRLGQLQLFSETLIKKCKPFEEVKSALEPAEALVTEFKEGMLKDKSVSIDKKELDAISDRLISGLSHNLKAELEFPQASNEAKIEQGKIEQIIDKFGTKITKYSYTDQPAAVDNMLTELGKVNLLVLGNSGIERWVPLIKEANENFKKATLQFVGEKTKNMEQDSASALAPELINALNKLLTIMFAFANIGANPELVKTYSEISVFTDTYK